MDDPLVIAGKEFSTRLMVGTGRHRTMDEMVESIEASGAEIITVAIRRLNLDNPNEKSILDYFDWDKYTILPNTAACRTAEEAVFVAKLARELTGSNWVKLEVIPDAKWLLPDPVGTYEAAKILIDDGFVVLPYIHADPVLAMRLEEIGCATVMPLGSAIGSGQGILTLEEVKIIVEQASIPVVVDAGLGVPSEASQAMEIGAQAVLVNTAIAQANDPASMGEAFKLGVQAGRKAYLAGRIERKAEAKASSPTTGVVQTAGARSGWSLRPIEAPFLCFVTDRKRCGGRDLEEVVDLAVEHGAGMVQLREKDLSSSDLLDLGKRVKEAIRGRAALIVNGNVEVAVALNADGVHLPEDGIPVGEARRAIGANKLIGRSVHSAAGAAQAQSDGADYLIAGTIFPTASHPNQPAQGVGFLRTLRRHVSLPVLAIGGVTAKNVGDIMATGASGAAVITAISEANDPGLAAKELCDAMQGASAT